MMRTLYRRRRTGIVLVAAMICLVVVTALGGGLLRATLREQRRAERREQQLQALWLTESAIDRAVTRWKVDPNYSGETWQIPAASLVSDEGANVDLQIEPVAGQDSLFRVHVEARCGEPRPEPVLWRKTIEIEKPDEKPETGDEE